MVAVVSGHGQCGIEVGWLMNGKWGWGWRAGVLPACEDFIYYFTVRYTTRHT